MKNHKLRSFFGNLDVWVASVVLILLVVLTFLGVIWRRVFGAPFTWLEEVQLACMVWIVFAAGGAAFRTGNHVAIEMIVDMMPKKVQKIMEIVIAIISILIIAYLFKQSLGFVEVFLKSGRSTSMLHIPYSLIYGIAPVSYVLMVVSYVYAMITGVQSEAKEAVSDE